MAVDGSGIYFGYIADEELTWPSDGVVALNAAPLSGGSVETVMAPTNVVPTAGAGGPVAYVLDACYVYVVQYVGAGATGEETLVLRVPKLPSEAAAGCDATSAR